MRAVLAVVLVLGACNVENVAPLSAFGPLEASIDAELGPLSAESGRDVNPRIHVAFFHAAPDCPVFDDDIDASIDGVRPSSFEHGYYDDSTGYGHNDDPVCQSPFFSIDRVPRAQSTSILRLADATAELSLAVDRLFVNPAMTLSGPLARGSLGHIDVADDRTITKVEAEWWDGDETSATIHDVMPTLANGGISFRMPTNVGSTGHLEVRVELATPMMTCSGFASCSVTIKGSAMFAATL